MIEALLELPPFLRQRLASALETGLLSTPFTEAQLRSVVGPGAEEAVAASREWARLGVSGAAAAAWLRSLDQANTSVVPASFVWTGPGAAKGLHSRDTRQVYRELIASAKRSLLISTYAYFDGPQQFRDLAAKMDANPSLRVTLLLNIDRGRRSTTKADQLVLRFADQFWNRDWPGQAKPSVYYDPRSLAPEGPGAVLHAKAVIADEQSLFVTSANLTEAAQDRNIEVGVLLNDRTLALTALRHFRALIDQKLLHQIPIVRPGNETG